ncbi:MAG: hypothetical protein ACLVB5_05180 [Christensenellales bacterium]
MAQLKVIKPMRTEHKKRSTITSSRSGWNAQALVGAPRSKKHAPRDG